ncbi:hypothetical protein [Paraburkholderia fynbosensis]|uniref:hypothetical protein n=1 Tax=Paraburkholderia fynbosensis TaxID=1200993 RepID=UPI003CCCA942
MEKGVAAVHRVGIEHRELKPTNIMVTGGFQLHAVKVTDFGIEKKDAGGTHRSRRREALQLGRRRSRQLVRFHIWRQKQLIPSRDVHLAILDGHPYPTEDYRSLVSTG